MRLKLIACKVLMRELSYLCSQSENNIDVTWMRQKYHDRPDELRALLQKEIDGVEAGDDAHTNRLSEENDFDAILLGYGLCSNAVCGLKAARHRLVIPRAHDCITLFLGSKERYSECFAKYPGCFWYTAGWIDNTDMPCEQSQKKLRKRYEDDGYDEETIDYLIEELGGLKNYHNAAYISMQVFDRPEHRLFTKNAADYFGWDYREINGDMKLMERLLSGSWDDDDFLVLEPGETAVQSYDGKIIKKTDGGPK